MARTRTIPTISVTALAFLVLPLADTPAAAQPSPNAPMYFYVAKTGSNSNACVQAADSPCTSMLGAVCFAVTKPCLTIQGAIAKVPYEKRGSIFVSPGTYTEAVNIVGDLHHRIEIYGPYTFDGTNYACSDATQVAITAPGDTAVWAQDHGTVILGCMTLGPADTGFALRQFVIGDTFDVRFDQVTNPIAVTERSMMSCGGRMWLTTGGGYVASVNRSDLNFACEVIMPGSLSFTAVFNAARQSTVSTAGSTFTNTISGQKWTLSNSEIGPDCNVPGTGVTQDSYSKAPAGC